MKANKIIDFLSAEIASTKKLKKNLTHYAFSETLKGNMIFLNFKAIIAEVERLGTVIEFLEDKKREYIRLNETI